MIRRVILKKYIRSMEGIEITYFISSLCHNMLFGSKEDVENFDETLKLCYMLNYFGI